MPTSRCAGDAGGGRRLGRARGLGPHVTYHLAPVLAGAAWPVALRRGGPLRVARVDTRLGAMAGGAFALVAALVLWRAELLAGPTLWSDDPAIAETLPAVLIGAVGGHRHARCGPVP